jgi:hypothetical protein
MTNSINYRIARIIVEAYLEERGYAGKTSTSGFSRLHRRTKSGEQQNPNTKDGSQVDSSTKPGYKTLKLKSGGQIATGKGSKAMKTLGKKLMSKGK